MRRRSTGKNWLPRALCQATACAVLAMSFAAVEAADVPMTKVVLFNSGVGYFEHLGDVDGDQQFELKFNVEQINDLLKSLVLQDFGGGQIEAVGYGSK
ncbi:MAG TPA: hypothetical protein VG433_08530, partial [Pirellulales bacterium]|nr:hypothetical protein [Pirellulales bacterium]